MATRQRGFNEALHTKDIAGPPARFGRVRIIVLLYRRKSRLTRAGHSVACPCVWYSKVEKGMNNATRRFLLIIIISIFIHYWLPGSAQAQDFPLPRKWIAGQLNSDPSGDPVDYAYVRNININRSELTDSLGFFTVELGPKDTLVISRMGYLGEVFYPSDSLYYKPFLNLTLLRSYILIDQVDVHAFTWESFKEEIINNPAPEPERFGLDTVVSPWDAAAADFANSPTGVGVSIPLNLQSREQKQHAVIQQLENKRWIEEDIHSKFNARIISQTTGLTGDELTEFVLFANISDAYILRADAYEVIMLIKKRYRQYQQQKKGEW